MAKNCMFALVSGLLFGAGLSLSGMTDPAVVLAFLDVAGDWDPSLAFVMGGALAVYVPGYRLLMHKRQQPIAAERFVIPSASDVDMPLLTGAATFGLGWGLVGICPGPAVANLLQGDPKVAVFILAMLFGMVLANKVSSWRSQQPVTSS